MCETSSCSPLRTGGEQNARAAIHFSSRQFGKTGREGRGERKAGGERKRTEGRGKQGEELGEEKKEKGRKKGLLFAEGK